MNDDTNKQSFSTNKQTEEVDAVDMPVVNTEEVAVQEEVAAEPESVIPSEVEGSADNNDNEAGDEKAHEQASGDLSPESPLDSLPARDDEGEVSEVEPVAPAAPKPSDAGRWYVVHTYSGHENKVATQLKQRIESEHLEHKIFDILVPTQDKIEIRGGKKVSAKEKIFPGYILIKMLLDDAAWLAVRTTQGVTSFVGINNKPTPIPESEVTSIIQFMSQGAAPTFKDVFMVDDTVKIIDGPFAEFIGKVDSVDKEKGKVRVLVSIFGRETPVELDFLQVTKL